MGEISEVGRKGFRNISQPWRSLARPTEWVSEVGFEAGGSRESNGKVVMCSGSLTICQWWWDLKV